MMEKVVISDIDRISQIWKYELECLGFQVIGYATKREKIPRLLDGVPVFDLNQMASLYQNGISFKFVIPRERFCTQEQSRLFPELKRLGIKEDDILLTTRLSDKKRLLEKYMEAKYLPYLEFHIADHCNLNCAACEHFSGLAEEKLHGAEGIRRDLSRLSGLIEDIGVIRILGGEPLLNPEVADIIRAARSVYKIAQIHIVTNGLLLDRVSRDFFHACVDCDATIHISFYPPMIPKQGRIESILKAEGVNYLLAGFNSSFRKKYTLVPHDNGRAVFENCIQACCNNLYDGRMAACFLPFTQTYFNNCFDKDIPCGEAISIYDSSLTTEKLKKFLQQPLERCRYCRQESIEERWHVAEKSSIREWIVGGEGKDD